MTGVKATLYVFPGSHAAMIGRLLPEHKGIAYKRVDLLPVVEGGRFAGVVTTAEILKLDDILQMTGDDQT